MKALIMVPPARVRLQFLRGLDLYANGRAGEGLRPATVAWARRLASGGRVSGDKARRMVAWFARHGAAPLESAARQRQEEMLEQGTLKGRAPALTAWLLWGGDAGRAWAQGIVERLAESREGGAR